MTRIFIKNGKLTHYSRNPQGLLPIKSYNDFILNSKGKKLKHNRVLDVKVSISQARLVSFGRPAQSFYILHIISGQYLNVPD